MFGKIAGNAIACFGKNKMIYLPVHVQLQMIREDLKEIKDALFWRSANGSWLCPDCLDMSCTGSKCNKPEMAMTIKFPL